MRSKKKNDWDDDLEDLNLYISESLGVVITVVMIFFAISLYSHHPHDNTPFYFISDAYYIKNWGGSLGANVSAVLYHFLGFAAYFLVGALGMLAYMFLLGYRRGRSWASLLMLPVCIASAALIVALYNIDFVHGEPGGMIGFMLNTYLSSKVGFYGTAMIGWALLWVSIVMVLRVSIVRSVVSLIKNAITSRVTFFF